MSSIEDSDAPSSVVADKLKRAAEKKRAQRKAREEIKKLEVTIDESKNTIKKIAKRKKEPAVVEEPVSQGYTIEKIEAPVKKSKPVDVPPPPPPAAPKQLIVRHTDLPSALDRIFKQRDPYYRFKIAGVAAAFAGVVGYTYAPTLAVALNSDLR